VRTADGSENYKLRFNTTLQGKVSERISMNIRYEYEFDSAVFVRDAEYDQRITSSLAYAF
jgi:putative salt-induced outer membrane protein YdiY